jgi:hypothetical protein
MTRTISFIIGIAVAALAVAVPTAFGEGRLAGSPEQNGVAYFYANERATLAAQGTGLVSRPDSHEVAPSNDSVVSRPDSHDMVPVPKFGYIDASERADRINSLPTNDVVLLSGDDKSTFGQPNDTTVQVPVASSGTDIDWSQLGIGFGIGVALALGLLLMVRVTRHNRPLAH